MKHWYGITDTNIALIIANTIRLELGWSALTLVVFSQTKGLQSLQLGIASQRNPQPHNCIRIIIVTKENVNEQTAFYSLVPDVMKY